MVSTPTGPPGTAIVLTDYPYGTPDGLDSQYVGPGANQNGAPNNPVGNYDYRTTFVISPGDDPGTASIAGSVLADDSIEVYPSGVDTGVGFPTPAYSSLNRFVLTSGHIGSAAFDAGTNTLDFVVFNVAAATALRVDNLSGTVSPSAVPEPSSLALCGLAGLIGSAYAWRRRKVARPAA